MTRKLSLPALALASSWSLPASAAQGCGACAGHYIDTLPATIAAQGTWCPRHDCSTATAGIAASDRPDISIRHCAARGFLFGAALTGSSGVAT